MAAKGGSHSLGYSYPGDEHTPVSIGATLIGLTAKVKIGQEAGRRDGQHQKKLEGGSGRWIWLLYTSGEFQGIKKII